VIWTGQYEFDLNNSPAEPPLGWGAGKGGPDTPIDLLIIHRGIQGCHVSFNFHHDTGHMYLTSNASRIFDGRVTVKGLEVGCGEMHAFNQTPTHLAIGRLGYIFEYTDIVRTEHFYNRRKQYMADHLDISAPTFSLTPIPSGPSQSIGEWTLGPTFRKGTSGKVYAATNSKAQLVAIKIVERNSSEAAEMVRKDIQVLRDVSRLAEDENDERRLLRLKDVIYQYEKEEYTPTHLEDVMLILEPAVEYDFEQLTDIAKDRIGRHACSNAQ
jgi:hypothetical protein